MLCCRGRSLLSNPSGLNVCIYYIHPSITAPTHNSPSASTYTATHTSPPPHSQPLYNSQPAPPHHPTHPETQRPSHSERYIPYPFYTLKWPLMWDRWLVHPRRESRSVRWLCRLSCRCRGSRSLGWCQRVCRCRLTRLLLRRRRGCCIVGARWRCRN